MRGRSSLIGCGKHAAMFVSEKEIAKAQADSEARDARYEGRTKTKCVDIPLSDLLQQAIVKVEVMSAETWDDLSEVERSSMWIAESYKELTEMSYKARRGGVDTTVYIRAGEYSDPIFTAFIDDVIRESESHCCGAGPPSSPSSSSPTCSNPSPTLSEKQKMFGDWAEAKQGQQGYVINPERLIESYL